MTAATGTDANAHYSADANYQAWLALLDSVLDSAGLTQTADTGQWTGSEARPASGQPQYQLREFGDGLIVKIDVGVGTATTRPAMAFSVGTGSDGSGNVTGVLGSRAVLAGSSSSQSWTTGGASVWACATADDVFAIHCQTDPDIPFLYAFQRRQDAAGANVLDGQTVIHGPSKDIRYIWDGASNTFLASNGSDWWPGLPWGSQASLGSRDGVNIHLAPGVTPWVDPVEYGTSDALIAYRDTEITTGVTFQAEFFPGLERTYIATGLTASGMAGARIAMIYE